MRRCMPPEKVSTRSLARSASPTRVENFVYPRFQGRSTQPIEMALMPEVLISGQLGIDALRLEHDSNLAAKAGGILRGIASP